MATGQALAIWIGWLRSSEAAAEDRWSAFCAGLSDALGEAGIEASEVLETPLECLAARAERAVQQHPKVVAKTADLVRRVLDRHPDLANALRSELEAK